MGIVHRDLKLENVLINENGYISLIDFGVAKRLKFGDTAETVIGTPMYMPPEMLKK